MTENGVTPNTSELGLITITNDGKFPSKRIPEARDAVELIKKFRLADQERLKKIALAKRIRDHQKPYNQAMLDEEGRGWEANFSTGNAESDCNNAKTPYYILFSKNPRYLNLTLEDIGDPSQRYEWSNIMSDEVSNLLKQEGVFDFEMQRSEGNMVEFGIGPVIWENEFDFHIRAIACTALRVPNEASTDVNKWEMCGVDRDFLVGELQAKIQDKAPGWNLKQVKKSIAGAHTKMLNSGNYGVDWYNEWADKIRRNDLWYSYDSQVVQCAHVLVKELDGSGISHAIVDMNQPDEYLYYKKGRYENFSQFIVLFPFDIGDGTVHSIKGLIVKNSDLYQIQDRLNCSIVNAGFLSSTLIVKAQNEMADKELDMVKFGGAAARLPANVELQQNSLGGLINGPLGVDRYLEQRRLSNMGQYKRSDSQDGVAKTAEEIRYMASTNATLADGQITCHYYQLDMMVKEIVRRIFNPKLTKYHPGGEAALKCRERIMRAGVPKEAFQHIGNVHFYRNFGNGSTVIQEQQLSKLVGIMGLLPESARDKGIKMLVATILGQELANDLLPAKKEQTASDEEALATMELSTIRDGITPLVTETQDHIAHISVHARDMFAELESQDLMRAYQILTIELPHAKQHFAMIANDTTRKSAVTGLARMLADIENAYRKLTKNVQDMMQAQFDEQQRQAQVNAEAQMAEMGMDPDTRLKMAKVNNDFAVQMKKADDNYKIKLLKTEQQINVNEVKTNQQMGILDAKTRQELTINDIKTAQEVRHNAVKTVAE